MTRGGLFGLLGGLILMFGCSVMLAVQAADTGLLFKDDCSTLSGLSSGKVICWDRTANQLKKWNGSRWDSDVTGFGIRNVKDFGAKGDAVENSSCTINATSNSISCTNAIFNPATDAGKLIAVERAGSGHAAPSAPTIALNTDSTSDQVTAGAHKYKFALRYRWGLTAASAASSEITHEGTHTSTTVMLSTPPVTWVAIRAAGTGYVVGETITYSGGTSTTAAQATVKAVGLSGEVKALEIAAYGVYRVVPSNPVSTTASAAGTGLTVDIWWLDTSGTFSQRTPYQPPRSALTYKGVRRSKSIETRWQTPTRTTGWPTSGRTIHLHKGTLFPFKTKSPTRG